MDYNWWGFRTPQELRIFKERNGYPNSGNSRGWLAGTREWKSMIAFGVRKSGVTTSQFYRGDEGSFEFYFKEPLFDMEAIYDL